MSNENSLPTIAEVDARIARIAHVAAIAIARKADGISVPLRKYGRVPTVGYIVSLAGYESVENNYGDYLLSEGLNSYSVRTETAYQYYRRIFSYYLDDKFTIVGANVRAGTAYFGVWKHAGDIYLDISVHYRNLHNAQVAGRENHQKAIYCLHSGESIYL